MSTNKISNVAQLRDEIGEVFVMLRNKQIETHDAATLAKLGDTMISSSKVELDQNKFLGLTRKISFLESE